MKSTFQLLDVNTTQFDYENPRIKKALEKYGDKITPQRISFALRTASDESSAAASFSKLKDSIRALGSITQPISVVMRDDIPVCIDGNTRLAIYKDYLDNETEGNWSNIPALVITDATQKDIESIRVSAHLIGPREWPAYEKARYLHYLYNQEFMEFGEMVVLCGGNKVGIKNQIEAYEDMNKYYRDRVDDTAFHIDRFSGFVELQKSGIKESIFDAGFDLEDFGNWIRDGNIRLLRNVRQLPKVLSDEEARSSFVEGGIGSIEYAIKIVDTNRETSVSTGQNIKTLEHATLYSLASVLANRISELPFGDLQRLKENQTEDSQETLLAFEDLRERLGELLSHVRE